LDVQGILFLEFLVHRTRLNDSTVAQHCGSWTSPWQLLPPYSLCHIVTFGKSSTSNFLRIHCAP
jgi:hypothetical protein